MEYLFKQFMLPMAKEYKHLKPLFDQKKDNIESHLIDLDQATLGEPQKQTSGGIDLDANEIDLTVKGNDIDFSMLSNNPESIKLLQNIEGFSPVIINIRSVSNLEVLTF